jgi:hypothetical protein
MFNDSYQAEWRSVLATFWGPFNETVSGMREVRISEVIDALDAELGVHFFSDHNPSEEDVNVVSSKFRKHSRKIQ